jgi:hypothetical protein
VPQTHHHASLSHLLASVTQFRPDEGTHFLTAGITNGGRTPITVTQASIVWPGMRFPTVQLPDEPTLPGQTAAFRFRFGRARCAGGPFPAASMSSIIDGRRARLPLEVQDPGLLRRLRTRTCGLQRLQEVVGIALVLHSPAPSGAVPAEIVLRRRPHHRERVAIVDLGASVLIDVRPRTGRRALPGILRPGSARLRFPVRFTSAHRCDGHALGQSSQTFLLSAYVRVAGGTTQRHIFALSHRQRARLQAMIDRDCHGTGG